MEVWCLYFYTNKRFILYNTLLGFYNWVCILSYELTCIYLNGMVCYLTKYGCINILFHTFMLFIICMHKIIISHVLLIIVKCIWYSYYIFGRSYKTGFKASFATEICNIIEMRETLPTSIYIIEVWCICLHANKCFNIYNKFLGFYNWVFIISLIWYLYFEWYGLLLGQIRMHTHTIWYIYDS